MGDNTKYWLTGFGAAMVSGLMLVGAMAEQTVAYYLAVALTAAHIGNQARMIDKQHPQSNLCFYNYKYNNKHCLLSQGGRNLQLHQRSSTCTCTMSLSCTFLTDVKGGSFVKGIIWNIAKERCKQEHCTGIMQRGWDREDLSSRESSRTLQTETLQTGTLQTGTLQTGTLRTGTLQTGTLHRNTAKRTRTGRISHQGNHLEHCRQKRCKQEHCKQERCGQERCKQEHCTGILQRGWDREDLSLRESSRTLHRNIAQERCKQERCRQERCKQVHCTGILLRGSSVVDVPY